MVKFDFTKYRTFEDCPSWWRSFINSANEDPQLEVTESKLDYLASQFYCRIEYLFPGNINYLEFPTQDDFNTFKLHWTICGK